VPEAWQAWYYGQEDDAMYLKKVSVSKRILGASGILVGIVAVLIAIFIIKGNDVLIQKSSITPLSSPRAPIEPQKKSENSGTVMTPSNKWADETSNLKQAQSRLSRKIGALESALDELKANQNQKSADAGSDLNGSVDQENAAIETHEMVREKAKSQIKAQLDFMQEKLQSEPVDVKWADSAAAALYKSVQTNTTGDFAIIKTNFRSTFGRVDLAFNPALGEESFKKLTALIPWNAEVYFHADDIKSGKAAAYIARQDHSLPHVGQNLAKLQAGTR
jgi:hypothetical protein